MSADFTKEYRSIINMSLIANVDLGLEAGSHQEVIDKKTTDMKKKVGDFDLTPGWEVVWGPVVFWYPESKTVAGDHTWVILGNSSFDLGDGSGLRQVYVASFAGTNKLSTDDIKLDLKVARVVDAQAFLSSWGSEPVAKPARLKHADNTKAYISEGSAMAAYSIVSTSFGDETISRAIRRLGKERPQAAFVFGGLSLGGAIAPVMAYGAITSKLVDKTNTFVLAIAGPTPGNIRFCTELDDLLKPTRLGSIAKQQININIINDKDVVPKAWAVETLNEIPEMFGKLPRILRWKVGAWVAFALKASKASGATYSQMTLNRFTGPFFPPPENKKELWHIIGEQHVTAYLKRFEISPLSKSDVKAIQEGAIAAVPLDVEGTEEIEFLASPI